MTKQQLREASSILFLEKKDYNINENEKAKNSISTFFCSLDSDRWAVGETNG